jgi:hypothetical protein
MKKLLVVSILIFLVHGQSSILAQPGAPAGGDPPCGEPFGPPCPIDGVSLLIAAGVALGGKKAYDLKKSKEI